MSQSAAASAGRAAAASSGGSAGGTKKAGNATVADHMVATGAISAKSIPSGGVARGNYATQDDAYGDYSKAVGDYATRNFGNKLADFLAGPFYNENEPMAGNPRSFAKGRFHSSSNPAGMVASLASPFGSSLITGPVASKLYNGAGLPDIWHGGYSQPDIRSGPMGNAPEGAEMGKSFSDMGGMGGGSGAGAPTSSGRGDARGTQIPGPMQASIPSIFAQPQQQAQAQPVQSPSIFTRPPTPNPQPYMVGGGKPYGVNLFGRMA